VGGALHRVEKWQVDFPAEKRGVNPVCPRGPLSQDAADGSAPREGLETVIRKTAQNTAVSVAEALTPS